MQVSHCRFIWDVLEYPEGEQRGRKTAQGGALPTAVSTDHRGVWEKKLYFYKCVRTFPMNSNTILQKSPYLHVFSLMRRYCNLSQTEDKHKLFSRMHDNRDCCLNNHHSKWLRALTVIYFCFQHLEELWLCTHIRGWVWFHSAPRCQTKKISTTRD